MIGFCPVRHPRECGDPTQELSVSAAGDFALNGQALDWPTADYGSRLRGNDEECGWNDEGLRGRVTL